MDGLADFNYRSVHAFSKVSFVAYFLKERCVANKNDLRSEGVDFENWACSVSAFHCIYVFQNEKKRSNTPFCGQFVQRTPCVAWVDVEDITEQRHTWRMRDLACHFRKYSFTWAREKERL